MPTSPVPSEEQIVTYHLSETIVFALRELYRLFDGDLTQALVLGELGQHVAARKYLDSCTEPTSPTPRRSNAHSLAAAAGIPRETVRRKLDKLIAKGWVSELPDGGLTLNENLDTPLHLEFLDYHRTLLARMRDTIVALEGIDLTGGQNTDGRQKAIGTWISTTGKPPLMTKSNS